MADYTKSTGTSGTMKITDTGTKVQFWLKAGSATHNSSLPWGYTVNGTTDNSNSFNFETGGDWQMLKSWTVTTSQTVTFRLYDTGTSGLGGPTTLSAKINRATTPDAPSVTSSAVGPTFFSYTVTDGDDNGSEITTRRFGYSSKAMFGDGVVLPSYSQEPMVVVSSPTGRGTITGLVQGALYYIWAATKNDEGWSDWSARKSVQLLNVPEVPQAPKLSGITQTSLYATFEDNGNGGATILERQIGYGLTGPTPTSTVAYSGLAMITGLLPGRTYYFWSRSRNSVGWSSWSAIATATLIAGAFVNVGGVWKRAVPYVNVGGVWKVARPLGRPAGVWKETT